MPPLFSVMMTRILFLISISDFESNCLIFSSCCSSVRNFSRNLRAAIRMASFDVFFSMLSSCARRRASEE